MPEIMLRPLPNGNGRPPASHRVVRKLTLAALSIALLVGCTGSDSPPAPPDEPLQEEAPPAPDGGSDGAAGAAQDREAGRDPAGSDRSTRDGAGGAAPADPAPADPAPADPGEPMEPPDLGVQVRLTQVGKLRSPTGGAVGPDGTVHIISREGTVHRLTDDGVGDAVLDLRDEVSTGSERGLLGIAFAPGGDEVFLSYTDRAGDTAVTAFGVVDGRIDPGTRRAVFSQEQPYGNHNGGDIAFGPDRNLYLSLGDGGGAGDPLGAGQDLGTPLGSLVRIDPGAGEPYGIPDGNPFADDEEARDEIYAYGLRNPWRFSFDHQTGDLWIPDVGQSSREEINLVPAEDAAGANFGWSLMEGNQPFEGSEPPDHFPPVHTYETTPERCAVTGGYVYRGEAIPQLRGAYLFSDYCEGLIRALVVGPAGEVVDRGDLGVDGGSVVSFVEGAEGELYVLDLGGSVLRLEPG